MGMQPISRCMSRESGFENDFLVETSDQFRSKKIAEARNEQASSSVVKENRVERKSRLDPLLLVQETMSEPREIVCPMVAERDPSRVERLQEQTPKSEKRT